MASANISFSQVPSNVRKPGVYLEENTSNALTGLVPSQDKIVILAQKTASGSVASKTPTQVFADTDAALYFGQGSIAHLSAKAALEANPNLDLTVVGIDDNGSTYAKGSLGMTGQVGQDGALAIFIGDVEIDVSLTNGMTAAQGATMICGAIQNVQNLLPVTAGLTGSSYVTLTAKNAGTLGNEIALNYKVTAGLTGASFVAASPANGASDPDLGDYSVAGTVLNSIAGARYTIVANTLHDATNMGKVKNEIEFVSGPMEERPAIQVVAGTDEMGALATEMAAAALFNHGRTTFGYAAYTNGSIAKTESFKLCGAYAAMIAYNSDPVVPYDNLVLAGASVPTVPDRFTRTQQEAMLNNGLAPFIVIPGEELAICRAISTYVLNAYGTPDPTLLDINTYRSLDYLRFQVMTRLQNVFQRAKLSAKTPRRVVAQVLDVLYLLEQQEIIQNVDQYKSGVIAERDTSDPTRINIRIPGPLVTGLHVLAGVIQLIL